MTRVLHYRTTGGRPLVDRVVRPQRPTRTVSRRDVEGLSDPQALSEMLAAVDAPARGRGSRAPPTGTTPAPPSAPASPATPAPSPQTPPQTALHGPQQPLQRQPAPPPQQDGTAPQPAPGRRDEDGDSEPRRQKPTAPEPPDQTDETRPNVQPQQDEKQKPEQQKPKEEPAKPKRSRVTHDNIREAGTRKMRISSRLENVLNHAAEKAGVDRVAVRSGGQPARGTGGPRVGSTRHDLGGAADVDLFVGGRRLDSKNAADRKIIADFIEHSAAAGATGIGGPTAGYMGTGRIHVGFGREATWNAPTWARRAHARGRSNQVDPGRSTPDRDTGTTTGTSDTTTTTGRVSHLHRKLRSELGLTSAQASGVVGSLMGESGTRLDPSARNPSSGAFGVAQWLGSRLTALRRFAKSKGKSASDFEVQTAFLIHESRTNPSEQRAVRRLKQTKTPAAAAAVWTRLWERPSPAEIRASLTRRQNLAREIERKAK